MVQLKFHDLGLHSLRKPSKYRASHDDEPIKTLYIIFSVAVFDGGDVSFKFGIMGYVLG
jgi:hypothetical protein